MANQQRPESERSATQTTRQQSSGAQATQDTGTQASGASRERPQRGSASGLSRAGQSALASASSGQPSGIGPFAFMRRMLEDIDRMFDDVLARPSSRQKEQGEWPLAVWAPQVELAQRGDELVVRADLPGTREEDIRVQVLDDALVIEGERRTERQEERGDIFRSERMYGTFRRVIPLPDGADADNATARFADGVLEVRIKVPEQRQSRRQLEIKSGSQRGEDSGQGVH